MSPLPKTFTAKVSVRMPAQQRYEIAERLGCIGVAAALRDAALRAIGRADLIVGVSRDESGHRRKQKKAPTGYAVLQVSMTSAQREALDVAARRAEVSLSSLVEDSLLVELGMPAREAIRVGSLGQRKPTQPPRAATARKRRGPSSRKLLLTKEQDTEITRLYKTGVSQEDLAKRFRVSRGTIAASLKKRKR